MQVTFLVLFLLISLCLSFLFFHLYLFHIVLPLFYPFLVFFPLFKIYSLSSVIRPVSFQIFLSVSFFSLQFSLFYELFPQRFQLALQSKWRRFILAFGNISIRLPAGTPPNLKVAFVFFRHNLGLGRFLPLRHTLTFLPYGSAHFVQLTVF